MSLFENTNAPTEVKFEDLVGEGKKYTDTTAVAKALTEKDRFIQQLQNENAEMRKSMTTADRSQEILDRLEALRKTPTAESEPEPRVVERVVEQKGLTEEDLAKLLEQRDARKQAAANVEMVKAKLVEQFGPNYVQNLKSIAESTGVTPEYLEGIAATSPQAFLRLVLPTTPTQSTFTPPASSRPGEFQPTGGPHNKLSFYKKLQAENRAEYFSPKVQNKMYADAMALKEEFYDVS